MGEPRLERRYWALVCNTTGSVLPHVREMSVILLPCLHPSPRLLRTSHPPNAQRQRPTPTPSANAQRENLGGAIMAQTPQRSRKGIPGKSISGKSIAGQVGNGKHGLGAGFARNRRRKILKDTVQGISQFASSFCFLSPFTLLPYCPPTTTQFLKNSSETR